MMKEATIWQKPSMLKITAQFGVGGRLWRYIK
jgi:hypothetical protein